MNRVKNIIISIINTITIKKSGAKIAENLKINGRLLIKGDIEIGSNCTINSGIKYNPIGGDSRVCLITRNAGKIIIGDNVGISNSTLYSMNSITVEKDVMIGGSCKIYDSDFHSINYEDRIVNNNINIETKPVIIKEGAWIGGHSIILKGVIIGKHSVVGAGSVVTKSIPDYELWAGNPARFIKKINN